MENPFEIIDARLARIENLILEIKSFANAENPSTSEALLSIRQVAELINVSVPTIYSYVSRREIPHCKKGKRLYFFKTEILNWIKEGRKKTHSEIDAEAHTYLKMRNRKYE